MPSTISGTGESKLNPLRRSSLSPIAVTNPPNEIDWVMIPGIRKST